MKNYFWIALGGAIGCVARYGLYTWIKKYQSGFFPWHTYIVNLAGCFLIGICYAWMLKNGQKNIVSVFLMTGVLGGFTTFSSFGLETFELLLSSRYWHAAFYAFGSCVFGIMMVLAGYKLIAS
jgi:CrcB protein